MRFQNLTAFTALFFILFLFSGCAPTTLTKAAAYPKMYDQKPKSLLILPPMNESTDAEAKEYYMTTVEVPFAQMGYYTFPVEMVSDVMKQEGVYDTELLYKMPMNKFQEYFGADAVLFTKIKKWNVSYMVLASNLTVSVESKIVSTKTSEVLWQNSGTVVVDLSGGNNSGGGLVGLVVQVVATAVSTAAADYVKYARVANTRLVSTLPVGPYHALYLQDQDAQMIQR